MKKKHYVLIFIVAFIALIVYTGGCEFSSASISDGKICTSMNGSACSSDNSVITGNPSEIYASCELKYAPESTDIKFIWYYYGQSKIEIDQVTLNSGTNGSNVEVHSSLSRPNNGWPAGDYEVVIQLMIEGKDPIVKSFEVR
ncbi:MAG: hypothetical protein PF484_05260 [Bacteroidales bacterium]|jgi:hypothetical protein|nr:hypothetical protein [Bacteroidales bacterium]